MIVAGIGIFFEVIGYYAATYMVMETTTYSFMGQSSSIPTPTFPYMGLGYGLMGLGGILIFIGIVVFVASIMKQTNKEAIKEGIVEAEEEKRRIRLERLENIEGDVYCNACGFGNREGSRFCGKCGARLS